MRLSTVSALVALAAILAVAALALSAGGGSDRSKAAPAAMVDSRERADELPALAATEVKALGPEPVRVDESVEAVRAGDASVWRTPAGDGGVCLSLVGPDGATVNCVPRHAIDGNDASPGSATAGCKARRRPADDGGTFDVDLDCGGGEAMVYGVVSDAVEQVAIEHADGSLRPATFADGVYLATVAIDENPVAVVLSGREIDARLKVRLPGSGG